MLEENRKILSTLYDKFEESFKGLTLEGNYLVYNGEKIDISNFNINDLLKDSSAFLSSLSVLGPEDVFKIIRLHALTINSDLSEKKKNEDKIEIIKEENPLMKNISIVTRKKDEFKEEYINIVDSSGRDHMYINDRNVDIFEVYENLKITSQNKNVTPDDLIIEMNKRLYGVELKSATDLIDKYTTSEEFVNKLKRVSNPIKNDQTKRVVANEQHDIVVIVDLLDPTNHKVVTFKHNKFGDLVVQNHDQNVSGTDLKEQDEQKLSDTQVESEKTEVEVVDLQQEQIAAKLIPTQEFYDLLNSPLELTEEQRKSVDLYYGYFSDLIIYEDYLLPELKDILNTFRYYVTQLQLQNDSDSEELEFHELNEKQKEAIEKAQEMELKQGVNEKTYQDQKVVENIKKLEKLKPVNNYQGNNQGSASTLEIISIIIALVCLLASITILFIK